MAKSTRRVAADKAEGDVEQKPVKPRSLVDCPDTLLASVPTSAEDPPLVQQFQKIRTLGRGGFATAYEFVGLTDHSKVAAKVISKESLSKPTTRSKLDSEIAIHSFVSHPGIVRYLSHFDDDKNFYIMQELCSGRTLSDVVKKHKQLSERQAAKYLLQVLGALTYLHEHNIVHRDLKLSNLFIDQHGAVKVGDFGLACHLAFRGERRHTQCGTPNYIAPEVLINKETGHGVEVDVWALGVILYTMLVGKPPFETAHLRTTYKRIRANAYSFPDTAAPSMEAQALIRCLLRTDPSERPAVHEISRHAFFDSVRHASSTSVDVPAVAFSAADAGSSPAVVPATPELSRLEKGGMLASQTSFGVGLDTTHARLLSLGGTTGGTSLAPSGVNTAMPTPRASYQGEAPRAGHGLLSWSQDGGTGAPPVPRSRHRPRPMTAPMPGSVSSSLEPPPPSRDGATGPLTLLRDAYRDVPTVSADPDVCLSRQNSVPGIASAAMSVDPRLSGSGSEQGWETPLQHSRDLAVGLKASHQHRRLQTPRAVRSPLSLSSQQPQQALSRQSSDSRQLSACSSLSRQLSNRSAHRHSQAALQSLAAAAILPGAPEGCNDPSKGAAAEQGHLAAELVSSEAMAAGAWPQQAGIAGPPHEAPAAAVPSTPSVRHRCGDSSSSSSVVEDVLSSLSSLGRMFFAGAPAEAAEDAGSATAAEAAAAGPAEQQGRGLTAVQQLVDSHRAMLAARNSGGGASVTFGALTEAVAGHSDVFSASMAALSDGGGNAASRAGAGAPAAADVEAPPGIYTRTAVTLHDWGMPEPLADVSPREASRDQAFARVAQDDAPLAALAARGPSRPSAVALRSGSDRSQSSSSSPHDMSSDASSGTRQAVCIERVASTVSAGKPAVAQNRSGAPVQLPANQTCSSDSTSSSANLSAPQQAAAPARAPSRVAAAFPLAAASAAPPAHTLPVMNKAMPAAHASSSTSSEDDDPADLRSLPSRGVSGGGAGDEATGGAAGEAGQQRTIQEFMRRLSAIAAHSAVPANSPATHHLSHIDRDGANSAADRSARMLSSPTPSRQQRQTHVAPDVRHELGAGLKQRRSRPEASREGLHDADTRTASALHQQPALALPAQSGASHQSSYSHRHATRPDLTSHPGSSPRRADTRVSVEETPSPPPYRYFNRHTPQQLLMSQQQAKQQASHSSLAVRMLTRSAEDEHRRTRHSHSHHSSVSHPARRPASAPVDREAKQRQDWLHQLQALSGEHAMHRRQYSPDDDQCDQDIAQHSVSRRCDVFAQGHLQLPSRVDVDPQSIDVEEELHANRGDVQYDMRHGSDARHDDDWQPDSGAADYGFPVVSANHAQQATGESGWDAATPVIDPRKVAMLEQLQDAAEQYVRLLEAQLHDATCSQITPDASTSQQSASTNRTLPGRGSHHSTPSSSPMPRSPHAFHVPRISSAYMSSIRPRHESILQRSGKSAGTSPLSPDGASGRYFKHLQVERRPPQPSLEHRDRNTHRHPRDTTLPSRTPEHVGPWPTSSGGSSGRLHSATSRSANTVSSAVSTHRSVGVHPVSLFELFGCAPGYSGEGSSPASTSSRPRTAPRTLPGAPTMQSRTSDASGDWQGVEHTAHHTRQLQSGSAGGRAPASQSAPAHDSVSRRQHQSSRQHVDGRTRHRAAEHAPSNLLLDEAASHAEHRRAGAGRLGHQHATHGAAPPRAMPAAALSYNLDHLLDHLDVGSVQDEDASTMTSALLSVECASLPDCHTDSTSSRGPAQGAMRQRDQQHIVGWSGIGSATAGSPCSSRLGYDAVGGRTGPQHGGRAGGVDGAVARNGSSLDERAARSAGPLHLRSQEEEHVHAADGSGGLVVQWLDVSSKFGLGYVTTDGVLGVMFNDRTQAVSWESDTSAFMYLPRTRRESRQEQPPQIVHNPPPPELAKKALLLQKFHRAFGCHDTTAGQRLSSTGNLLQQAVRLQRWVRAPHAVIFCLSDGSVQAVFNDSSELLLRPDGQQPASTMPVSRQVVAARAGDVAAPGAMASFLDRAGGRYTWQLGCEQPSDPAVVKRLQYVQQLMQRWSA